MVTEGLHALQRQRIDLVEDAFIERRVAFPLLAHAGHHLVRQCFATGNADHEIHRLRNLEEFLQARAALPEEQRTTIGRHGVIDTARRAVRNLLAFESQRIHVVIRKTQRIVSVQCTDGRNGQCS